MVRIRATDVHLAAEGLRIRLRGDDTHRAAHRLSPIQGPLRAAQDLDARHIDDVRIKGLKHRCIVNVKAGGIRTLNAANCDAAGRERAVCCTDSE